jgi:hypothetical protein
MGIRGRSGAGGVTVGVQGRGEAFLMRALNGQGTPREAAEAVYSVIVVLQTNAAVIFAMIAAVEANSPQSSSSPQPRRGTEYRTSSMGC